MKKIKLIMLGLCFCILPYEQVYAVNGTVRYLDELQVEPRYQNVRSVIVQLKKNGRILTSTVDVVAYRSQNISIRMYLEEKTGGGWTSVKLWSISKSSVSCNISKTQTVSSGIYRVRADIDCGGEKIVKYSNYVNC